MTPFLNMIMDINTWLNHTLSCELSVSNHSDCINSVKVPILSLSVQVRLIDAGFLWTEPHSKRIKIKVTIQKEVRKTTNAITVGEWHSNWTGGVSLNVVSLVSSVMGVWERCVFHFFVSYLISLTFSENLSCQLFCLSFQKLFKSSLLYLKKKKKI